MHFSKPPRAPLALALLYLSAAHLGAPSLAAANTWILLGWSDLGINNMERDYSLFAIYPPYSTIHAQLIDPTGKLYTGTTNVTVTYQSLADPAGSIDTVSDGKTNFWSFAQTLFGGSAVSGTGITGNKMPGTANASQPMAFETGLKRFTATGIPITPYDDNLNLNYYPLMQLTARDASGNLLATARITLPVSNEVECRGCHASGVDSDARPLAGYAGNGNPNLDFKLNILQLHDEKNRRSPTYIAALAKLNYSASGLLATATGGMPVSCTACHASNQFNNPGISGIESLTAAMHSNHSGVTDPATQDQMENGTDRATCYNCHPGMHTQALRGVMGRSAGAHGSLQIQCQSCHGTMSAIGNPTRRGWIDLPNCQACHQGTVLYTNPDPLVLTNALDSTGALLETTDNTFATTSNQPVAGASLYRYSSGHGNLQCAACHGTTHAELPSAQPNDDLQASALTGQTGPIRDCTVCHQSGISSTNGGPHGMHNVGAAWISSHPGLAERDPSPCGACHGEDFRGTQLSTAYTTRTLSSVFGNIPTFRGYIVSCYTCHNGPGGEDGTRPAAIPTVADSSVAASSGTAVSIPITVTNAGVLRIISQPQNGTAYASGNNVVYQPNANFEGTDLITYAAQNSGGRDSNLGTATVKVTSPARPSIAATAVANAASYTPGIAPGMIAYIPGSGMGPAGLAFYELNSGGFIEKLTAGTRVLFNGIAAPVLYTSAGQVSAVVPFGVTGQTSATVAVEYNGIQSTGVAVPVAAASPGIFTANASGLGEAAVINQDASFNSVSNPAPRGSVITLFVTGAGMLNPQPVDGTLTVTPYAVPAQPVTVTIGGQPASVQYAGAAPGEIAGMLQVNAVVPADITAGATTVIVSVGGTASPTGVTVQVQ